MDTPIRKLNTEELALAEKIAAMKGPSAEEARRIVGAEKWFLSKQIPSQYADKLDMPAPDAKFDIGSALRGAAVQAKQDARKFEKQELRFSSKSCFHTSFVLFRVALKLFALSLW